MAFVDLLFPVQGGTVPLDHGYLLFSALSARLPQLHERRDVGVFHLRGAHADQELLHLTPGKLRLRCPAEAIPGLLPLAGDQVQLGGRSLMLGAPMVRALEPVPHLSARLVTFKHALEEGSFRTAAGQFLEALLGKAVPFQVGRRRVVTVAGKTIVGFGLEVSGLQPEDSLVLQEKGLGGRRHMGCGLFLPHREQQSSTPRLGAQG